jgi:hypothetical protein
LPGRSTGRFRGSTGNLAAGGRVVLDGADALADLHLAVVVMAVTILALIGHTAVFVSETEPSLRDRWPPAVAWRCSRHSSTRNARVNPRLVSETATADGARATRALVRVGDAESKLRDES